jgi:pimeloyl-ACP methyl ester carboxylesterase
MTSLNYREMGSGQVVILIHGFPMNQHVWDDLAEKLCDTYHVVTFDLPGFGKSAHLPTGFSLEDVASVVLKFIREKKYQNPIIIGHSLGGYVALALAAQAPEVPGGICLFHSTALADSNEKKESRNKVLDFIEKQGVHAFTSNFISQLYADPQHHSIVKVKRLAAEAERETVEGYTRAMRDRQDRTNVIASFPRPILFLGGEKDQGIPPETLVKQASLNSKAEAIIMPEVAHMGMFEAEATCLKKITGFIEKCLVTFSGGSV